MGLIIDIKDSTVVPTSIKVRTTSMVATTMKMRMLKALPRTVMKGPSNRR